MTLLNVTFIRATISITDSYPSTMTKCTKYGQQVPRNVLQLLYFEWWGVLLHISFAAPPFGHYTHLPAVVPLLEAILQAIHCDPVQCCQCSCLNINRASTSPSFLLFQLWKAVIIISGQIMVILWLWNGIITVMKCGFTFTTHKLNDSQRNGSPRPHQRNRLSMLTHQRARWCWKCSSTEGHRSLRVHSTGPQCEQDNLQQGHSLPP